MFSSGMRRRCKKIDAFIETGLNIYLCHIYIYDRGNWRIINGPCFAAGGIQMAHCAGTTA